MRRAVRPSYCLNASMRALEVPDQTVTASIEVTCETSDAPRNQIGSETYGWYAAMRVAKEQRDMKARDVRIAWNRAEREGNTNDVETRSKSKRVKAMLEMTILENNETYLLMITLACAV